MSDTLTQPLRLGSAAGLETVQRRRRFVLDDARIPSVIQPADSPHPESPIRGLEPEDREEIPPGPVPVPERAIPIVEPRQPDIGAKEPLFAKATIASDRHEWPLRPLSTPVTASALDVRDADGLIDRIVCAEQEILLASKRYRPLFEAYLQESFAGGAGMDHYLLARLALANSPQLDPILGGGSFRESRRNRAGSVRQRSWITRRPSLSATALARMLAPDFADFNAEVYRIDYRRREFLGAVCCLVLDVQPRHEDSAARFRGRVWAEDQNGCIVRFSGVFQSTNSSAVYFHFDSWRFPVAPRLWLPDFTYIEDHTGNERVIGHLRLWDYDAVRDSARFTPKKQGTEACALGPLESLHRRQQSAELNVLDRLDQCGLLAGEGEVDEMLRGIVGNLLAETESPPAIRCRVLLTTPLETLSIGQSILIGRGLLDVLPDEASLAMVLSDELAHILLGHPADPMLAFADRMMFPDRELVQRLRLKRTPAEMESAHRKAIELLSRSPYADKMTTAGLFLKTLRRCAPQLPNLIHARIGNPLTTEEDLVRLGELAKKTPELKTSRAEQVAALPLASRIQLDPWTNRIRMIEGHPLAPRNGADAQFAVYPLMVDLAGSRESECRLEQDSLKNESNPASETTRF